MPIPSKSRWTEPGNRTGRTSPSPPIRRLILGEQRSQSQKYSSLFGFEVRSLGSASSRNSFPARRYRSGTGQEGLLHFPSITGCGLKLLSQPETTRHTCPDGCLESSARNEVGFSIATIDACRLAKLSTLSILFWLNYDESRVTVSTHQQDQALVACPAKRSSVLRDRPTTWNTMDRTTLISFLRKSISCHLRPNSSLIRKPVLKARRTRVRSRIPRTAMSLRTSLALSTVGTAFRFALCRTS
jgi:hypothetical protein